MKITVSSMKSTQFIFLSTWAITYLALKMTTLYLKSVSDLSDAMDINWAIVAGN
jgi:hypothetical protein